MENKLQEKFTKYLKIVNGKGNKKLSPKTIKKYSEGVSSFLKDNFAIDMFAMKQLGEYNLIKNKIFENSKFIESNKTGNSMYSASMNWYSKFLEHISFIDYDKTGEERTVSLQEKEIENINNRIPELEEFNIKKYKTKQKLKNTVIFKKKYLCEIDKRHTSFSNGQNNPYMEGHHLIPMSFQNTFKKNIDCEANIVSLCPNCHKAIHYGNDEERESRLNKLYSVKEEELKKQDIYIF